MDHSSSSSTGGRTRRMTEEARAPGLIEIDTNEYGGKKDGVRQAMDRRLFMQLLVFDTVDVAGATRDL